MKRFFCVLMLLLALVCVFAACDSTKTPNTDTNPPSDEHTHIFGEWSVTTASTCSAKGAETRTCNCGESETREIAALAHTFGEWSATTAATCGVSGKEKRTCTCGAFETRDIPATGAHNYQNGACSVCTAPQPYVRNGNKVYFGSYPQSEVTEAVLVSTLNDKAGTLPTSADAQSWTSYGYYIEGTVQNYMWYIDISEGGERYRGVYFTRYRPETTTTPAVSSESYQSNNGFLIGTAYWFKYEPVQWTVLKEEEGVAFLLCDMILDAQAYQNERTDVDGTYYTTFNGAPDGIYANNYAYSTIRSWLNDTFYETAFTELEQQIILTTTVKNDIQSTGDTDNPYVCQDTQDKIFLLSAKDVMNAEYGFSTEPTLDETRKKAPTPYAQAQGAYKSWMFGNGMWYLRSPYGNTSIDVRGIGAGSVAYDRSDITCIGTVPALQIFL